VVGDPDLLSERARRLGLNVRVTRVDIAQNWPMPEANTLAVWPVPCAAPITPGQLDKRNSEAVIGTIKRAVWACQRQIADAVVTAPAHKAIINEAGYDFTGHTELLASLSAVPYAAMMLLSANMKVVVATQHLPLKMVSPALTRSHLQRLLTLTATELQSKLGYTKPRIGVCGLNPHAGEHGLLGDEEQQIIQPVIETLQKQLIGEISGPWPADTLFNATNRQAYDTIVAMYHDQGLAPLKAVAFGEAVNLTLGLPFIRTSVDHGTALDQAGTGNASADSFRQAIKWAQKLAKKQCHAATNQSCDNKG